VPLSSCPVGGIPAVACERAEYIAVGERDRALGIDGAAWPENPPRRWASEDGVLRRHIRKDKGRNPAMPVAMEETMLRFPSAPIHGLQRLHEHHMKVGDSEVFHTMRVLRSAEPKVREKRISRIFLMHCGLNELRRMGLYYRLSARLIKQESTTACIIRPFPGHLTRYPFQSFAETPLDNYLWDGSHLFRQFLRFMAETQWLLSAIVRRSSFPCASGANLLAEEDEPEGSRLSAERLAADMFTDLKSLHDASWRTAEAESEDEEQTDRPDMAEPPEEAQILDSILALRAALDLGRFEERGADPPPRSGRDPEPKLHVLGYSLGGFTAQSVFMSWPFLIASCSTLLAGGALRELAPIGFTDPEEWQTVLHSLRYELDDRMMSRHVGIGPATVAGMDHDLFTYFKRTFYEVFQQEYRGSIQSRYRAFRDRMLFIVGGDDPVVRPENVLQSGPKGGLNLLEIGGLTHFIDEDSDDPSNHHQRTFWIPEMATFIHRFANNAGKEEDEHRPCTWFDADLAHPLLPRDEWQKVYLKSAAPKASDPLVLPLSPTEEVAIGPEGELDEQMFERCLDDLLHRVRYQKDGMLFALRNEVPGLMLPAAAVRETAAALYHDDLQIARYCHGIAARRQVLEEAIERTCVVLPWNAGSIMRHLDLQRAYPSQAESAGGQVRKRGEDEATWKESLDYCYELVAKKKNRPSIRLYDGNRASAVRNGDHRKVIAHGKKFMREDFVAVPSLADCWVWISSAKVAATPGGEVDAERGIDGLLSLLRDIGGQDADTLGAIREGWVRIVDVSRARYNPRFRGRLVVDGKAARKRLLHAALCLAISEPIMDEAGTRILA
jgi:hypothetical protein